MSGFRGVLRQVSLEDVIQMECLNRNSSILEVIAGKQVGKLYVKEGMIIHAEIGERNGEAAFNKILTLKGGEFNLRPFVEPTQSSIDASWEFLLMESARSRDEAAEAAPEEAPIDPTQLPLRQNLGHSMPLPAAPARAKAVAPEPVFKSNQPANQPVRIDEMLVCSAKGDVLYEWKCGSVNDRISFLEFLSQKSGQLSEGLNLGEFDRLEMEGESHRVIAQVKSDRGIFVRTKKVPMRAPLKTVNGAAA
jgi:hypothetical protein